MARQLDETKWNRLGDWKRRDGYWIKEDAYLSGKGTLVLRTRKDGDRYTCGAVNTKGKFEHAFGYYVARCKMPNQPGHWPAFWLMSSGVNTVGDEGRDGTEIDIVEVPWRDGRLTANLHWDGYGKDHKSRRHELLPSGGDERLAHVRPALVADRIRVLRGRPGNLAHRCGRRVAGAGVYQAHRGDWQVGR